MTVLYGYGSILGTYAVVTVPWFQLHVMHDSVPSYCVVIITGRQ